MRRKVVRLAENCLNALSYHEANNEKTLLEVETNGKRTNLVVLLARVRPRSQSRRSHQFSLHAQILLYLSQDREVVYCCY